mmetsp:Transcript_2733/g.5198  ORF Transcript_2733/g.5198 Transcript_2733/m.5198 type:complete len:518 (+) Transcript_2733:38-1591(+)
MLKRFLLLACVLSDATASVASSTTTAEVVQSILTVTPDIQMLSDMCNVCGYRNKINQASSSKNATDVDAFITLSERTHPALTETGSSVSEGTAWKHGKRVSSKNQKLRASLSSQSSAAAAPFLRSYRAGLSVTLPFVMWKDNMDHSFGVTGFCIELWEAITTGAAVVNAAPKKNLQAVSFAQNKQDPPPFSPAPAPAPAPAAPPTYSTVSNVLEYAYYKDTHARNWIKLVNGDIDMIITGVNPVQAPKSAGIRFSTSFWFAGVSMAVNSQTGSAPPASTSDLLGNAMFIILPVLVGCFIIGHIYWLIERPWGDEDDNDGSVPRLYWDGIGVSLWWAAVTMTTVGYGDYSPKRKLGKALGMVWMFVGLFILATFTAELSSLLVASELGHNNLNSLSQLGTSKVATVQGTFSDSYMAANYKCQEQISFVNYTMALNALAEKKVDVVVGSSDTLRFMANMPKYRDFLKPQGQPIHLHPLVFAYGRSVPQSVIEYLNERILLSQQKMGVDYLVNEYFNTEQ